MNAFLINVPKYILLDLFSLENSYNAEKYLFRSQFYKSVLVFTLLQFLNFLSTCIKIHILTFPRKNITSMALIIESAFAKQYLSK
jgi:exosortase/archaeosortase